MRLLQSVLATLPQTRKPQRKFITHLLGLVLMLPGHATFRNLSRYSSCHERTFARWYDRPFDFVSLKGISNNTRLPLGLESLKHVNQKAGGVEHDSDGLFRCREALRRSGCQA